MKPATWHQKESATYAEWARKLRFGILDGKVKPTDRVLGALIQYDLWAQQESATARYIMSID